MSDQVSDRATPEPRYSSSDKKLLESGSFSDVIIKCENRTWNVHRAIICPRCPFFEKAFNGPFQESTTGELVLHDQVPGVVDEVIRYLYTGTASNKVDAHPLDLFKGADFFGVPSLAYIALKQIKSTLQEIAKKANYGHFIDVNNIMTPEEYEDFLLIVKAAFGSGSATYLPLRDPVLRFISLKKLTLANDEKFQGLLEELPILAVEMVKLLARPLTTFQDPKLCWHCKSRPVQAGRLWILELASRASVTYRKVGVCAECEEHGNAEG